MIIRSRIRAQLAWTLPVIALVLLLTGCGERSNLKYPDLPATHPLNYNPIW